jgi:glycerate-2-kinase
VCSQPESRILKRPARTWIIAAGKAAPAMTSAAVRFLGSSLGGGVVASPGSEGLRASLDWFEGHHPVPDAQSELAGRRALALATGIPQSDRLLVLLSGGASAMMAVPAEGLTLADKQAATAQLLRSGADIHSLNAVRKHLSAIKGGQLAAAAAVECVTLAVSDVVGDDLSVIGSGPTIADGSTYQDALAVLNRFGGHASYPPSIISLLSRGASGQVAETPKPGDARLSNATAHVIGNRYDAMRGASEAAEAFGYSTQLMDAPVVGEARDAAHVWLDRALDCARHMASPACVVSSGETTVHVRGDGRGGRNQEFALALVESIATLRDRVAVASVGTDGVDGPTVAAGAFVDSTTAHRAARANLRPEAFLNDNNAHDFFAALGDLALTGATGTNVGDIQILLLA